MYVCMYYVHAIKSECGNGGQRIATSAHRYRRAHMIPFGPHMLFLKKFITSIILRYRTIIKLQIDIFI